MSVCYISAIIDFFFIIQTGWVFQLKAVSQIPKVIGQLNKVYGMIKICNCLSIKFIRPHFHVQRPMLHFRGEVWFKKKKNYTHFIILLYLRYEMIVRYTCMSDRDHLTLTSFTRIIDNGNFYIIFVMLHFLF